MGKCKKHCCSPQCQIGPIGPTGARGPIGPNQQFLVEVATEPTGAATFGPFPVTNNDTVRFWSNTVQLQAQSATNSSLIQLEVLKASAVVSNDQVTTFDPALIPPINIQPMIVISNGIPIPAVPIDSSIAIGDFTYAGFNVLEVDTNGLWDQSQFGFVIKRAGRYIVSTEISYLALPFASNIYPDALFIMFETRNSLNVVKATDYIVGAPGVPLFFDFGTGINSPMASSGILNLDVGDIVRVRLKAVGTQNPPFVTLLALGQILVSSSSIVAGSAYFSICEC